MSNLKFRKKLRDFSQELNELSSFAEVKFVWHFSNNDFLNEVLPEQTQNTSAFCRKTKGVPYKELRECIQFHHQTCFDLLKKNPVPMILTCHAGGKLLINPLMVSGEVAGVLYTGPFAGENPNIGGRLEREYRDLPRMSEEKLKKLGCFLNFRLEHEFKTEKITGVKTPFQKQIFFTDRRIGQAVHYMRLHYSKQLSAEETANVCCLSVSRFLHLFREQTGYTFSDWLQRLRISEAKRLAESTDLPLSAIAEISGIHDQSRMTVLFKRYLGVTASVLRKQSQH